MFFIQRLANQTFHNKKIPCKSLKQKQWLLALVLLCLTPPSSLANQDLDSHKMADNVQSVLLEQASGKAIVPKIQMVILLDTSNSMDGLIDQARNQIWSVVNEFSTAKRNGVTPILEVALYEYGNDNISKQSGYVRQLNGFTRELDRVSESLFALKTNGGSEYCGYAIKSAVEDLQWTQSNYDIKTIFIAGNEPFTQGPVQFKDALKLAEKNGVSVNTIFAGNFDDGVSLGWQSGAVLANGDYMSIDADKKIVHIDAPQDKQIVTLNDQLNSTYIPYGNLGKTSIERQVQQDAKNRLISGSLLVKRAKSKSSSFYNNSGWDLVDALEDGKVTQDGLAEMTEDQLPEKLQKLSIQERKDYVAEQARLRKEIKQEILELSELRKKYVAEKKRQTIKSSPSISDALTSAISKQAKEKGFEFEN